MNSVKRLVIATGLLAISSSAQAISIDFKALADGSIGESAWSTLMFKADGTHTTSAAAAFLDITGTNGGSKYAYMDSNGAGLGVCGSLLDSNDANTVFPNSGTNLCDPSSDDNVTYNNNVPEILHFVFDADVVIEKIWLNNNHDGDTSLMNDWVELGIDGATGPVQLTNGGPLADSVLDLDLLLGAGKSFDIGFEAVMNMASCHNDSNPVGQKFNNCEFYVSKIEFSTVPEPATLALLGLGLIGMGVVRRRRQ